MLPKVQFSKDQMLDIMEGDKMLEGLSHEQNKDILLKMSVFTNGLSMTMTKLTNTIPLEEALRLLEETAHQLVFAQKNKFLESSIP